MSKVYKISRHPYENEYVMKAFVVKRELKKHLVILVPTTDKADLSVKVSKSGDGYYASPQAAIDGFCKAQELFVSRARATIARAEVDIKTAEFLVEAIKGLEYEAE